MEFLTVFGLLQLQVSVICMRLKKLHLCFKHGKAKQASKACVTFAERVCVCACVCDQEVS